ncbi:MAG: MMPL family transporter [Solirubrobacterales bacterium]
MSRALYLLGRFCTRHRFGVVIGWVALMVATAVIANAVGKQTSNNLTLPGTGSTQAQDLLSANLPNQANGTNPVVMEAPHGTLDSGANAKTVKATTKSLAQAPYVIKAVSPLSTDGAAALSKDKRIGYISVTLDQSSADLTEEQANKVIDAESPATDKGFQVANGGYLGQAVSKASTESSEAVGIAAAIVILLFTFGTAAAMGLPIATALVGLVTGLAAIGLLGHGIDVPTVGPTLGTMLGLGVGIDYALFIVTRHRGFMEQGHPIDESAARAVATAGGAVVFAGGTVVIALCSLAVAQIPIVSALGYSAAIVVLIAVVTAVTLLPALLAILGKRIDSLRVPFLRPPAHDHRPHGWARWARGVGKRPLPAALLGAGILIVLAIPALHLQLGQQDNGQMPTSTQTRQAYDLLRQGFGPGSNGPFLVAVDFGSSPAHNDSKQLKQVEQQQSQAEQQAVTQATAQLEAQGVPPAEAQTQAQQEVSSQPPTKQQKQASQQEAFLKTPASDPRLVKLENQIGKAKGVKQVSPATLDKPGDTAVFTVVATTAPSADVTSDLVRHLRSPVIPDALKGTTLTAYVGGQTAGYIDLADRISEKLPLVIATVLVLSFLLLLIAFRSIVVPLTAGLMNLLSVGAAYGILTFVFQDGHGANLIGLDGAIPIVSYVPLLMFAILFGLSMDYQVFLLTRIQEHYRENEDNHEAVVDGLAVSDRVITSAALIMVSVYTSFILNGDPTVKQFGLGLAAAIAVDATIVRCLLVPSVMVMLGRSNWWLPGWLSRLVPRVGIEGDDYFRAKDAAAAASGPPPGG